MEIILREQNKYNRPTLWFRNQARNDTLTDVAFLNETTLVAGNREDAKLYLIEFNLKLNSIKIIDTIDLIYNRTPKHVDLFTIENNTIYIVSLDNTITIVKIINKKLILDTCIILNPECRFHGVTVKNDLLYLSGAFTDRKMTIYSKSRNKILKRESLENMNNYFIKQCKFLQNDYFVVTSNTGGVDKVIENKVYDGYLGVYRVSDWKCIDIINLGQCQLDDICVWNNTIYITYQDDAIGKIMTFTFENEKLKKQEKEYITNGFPHGIDVKYGIIAVTCYKASSICILPI